MNTIAIVLNYKKESKNFYVYEPDAMSGATGTLYLPKPLVGPSAPKKLEVDINEKEMK